MWNISLSPNSAQMFKDLKEASLTHSVKLTMSCGCQTHVLGYCLQNKAHTTCTTFPPWARSSGNKSIYKSALGKKKIWRLVISVLWKSSREAPACEIHKTAPWQGNCQHSFIPLRPTLTLYASLILFLLLLANLFPTHNFLQDLLRLTLCLSSPPPGCDTVVKTPSLLWGFFVWRSAWKRLMFSYCTTDRPRLSHIQQRRHREAEHTVLARRVRFCYDFTVVWTETT